jgi:hypothetical protein
MGGIDGRPGFAAFEQGLEAGDAQPALLLLDVTGAAALFEQGRGFFCDRWIWSLRQCAGRNRCQQAEQSMNEEARGYASLAERMR